ncbi:metal-dependent hydrolase [Acinetobacter baumannii]
MCIFEHFTAFAVGIFYSIRPELHKTLDQDALKLWVWHAIEEIEHRSPAASMSINRYMAMTRITIASSAHRSVTRRVCKSLAFYKHQTLFWQDKWKSLPKIGGVTYFWAIFAWLRRHTANSEYFALLQKTSTSQKL